MLNKNQMRWGVEVIGWLNFCIFVYSVHVWWLNVRKNQIIESMYFFCFFLFTACTSIIFFLPYYNNLCTFFAFFGLPCAHQSFFFLPYCKNLCTFFAFFDLQCAHQLFFFIFYCKNLYTCFLFTYLSFFSSIRIYVLFFLFTACTLE